MALSQEAVKSMLDAMKIISSAEMNNISYDKTVICTIVDNSHAAKESYYTVSPEDGIKFKAYVMSAEDATKYSVNDQVYVKVPQGDYSRQKVIEGYYVAETAEVPATYISPLNGFLDMSSLTADNNPNGAFTDANKALIANGKKEIAIWNWVIDPLSDNADDLQISGLYDTLAISGDFKCLLNKYRMHSGSYGLRLEVRVRLHPTSKLYTTHNLVLDSSEMFGNPYAFSLYSTQAKSFDISSIGIIDGMTLFFYQDDNFSYYDEKGQVIKLTYPAEETLGIEPAPNILLQNVYVALGSDVKRIADNSLKIYAMQDNSFKFSDANDSTNKKDIGFVWYNKNDDNQYIGFSDGVVNIDETTGKIIDYDELDYIKRSTANSRLQAQVGKKVPSDKNGLEMSANVSDAEILINNIISLVQINLVNTLNELWQRTKTFNQIREVDGAWQDSTDYFNNGLKKDSIDYGQNFETQSRNLIKWYKEALAAAADIQSHQTNGTIPEKEIIYTIPELLTEQLIENWNNFKGNFFNGNFILQDLKTAIENRYSGFQNIYDTYSIKLQKLLNEIQEKFDTIDKLLKDKEQLVSSANNNSYPSENYQYHIDKEISVFEPTNFSSDDNRYCVYWYKYDESATDDEILEPGWRRFLPDEKIKSGLSGEEFIVHKNLGLPSEYVDEGDNLRLATQTKPEEGFLQIFLNPEKKEEKIKVVLFYNHEKFVSDELVFTNADPVVDTTTLDVNASITISHGERSNSNYQTFYNSTNTLINQADSSFSRGLSVSYDGVLGDNDSLIDAQVFWYVPKNSSMLDVDVDQLIQKGFSTNYFTSLEVLDYVSKNENLIIKTGPGESYSDASKNEYAPGNNIEKAYEYKNGYYSLTPDNKIGYGGRWIPETKGTTQFVNRVVNEDLEMPGFIYFYKKVGYTEEEITNDKNEKEIVKKVNSDDLTFEYKIKNYYVPTALNNTIFCVIKKAEYRYETSISMSFGTQGTSGTDYTLLVQPSTSQRAVEGTKALPLSIQLFNYNNEEVPITAKTIAEQNQASLKIKWAGPSDYAAYTLEEELNVGVNSLSVNLLGDLSDPKYCGIMQVGTTIFDEKYNKAGGVIELSVKYPIPYSPHNYYIEGPTMVIYDSNGGNPVYYKEPYKLYDGDTHTLVENVQWDICYCMQKNASAVSDTATPALYTFKFIPEDNEATLPKDIQETIAFYRGYVPRLDQENRLIPSNMYISEVYIEDEKEIKGHINAYPVVYAYNSSGDILWAQPIVIDQNRYPNAVVNAWDGEFKIDEKNGTIMSSMVGAGYKNSDNTYSGVLMGNISGNEEVAVAGNKTDVGLYGFHHGGQSFGLNIDGTAFFGKSGRGRILIDGNDSTIQSQSYKENEIGMKIDLDDGFIDMRGTTYKNGNAESDGKAAIHIDVKSPYFNIHSSGDKDIIHIADKEYYLQSDNYTPGVYCWIDGVKIDENGYLYKEQLLIDKDTQKVILDINSKNVPQIVYVNQEGEPLMTVTSSYVDKDGNIIPEYKDPEDGESLLTKFVEESGQGTKIDLQNGTFDAYNLFLTSKNIYLDSREKANPYFVVRDDDRCNLIYAGTDAYYLKSHNFGNSNAAGLKIDLANGYLEGYNFSLKANAVKDQFLGSYILIDSGIEDKGPQMIVHYQENWVDTDGNAILTEDQKLDIHYSTNLLEVNADKFILHSKDWYNSKENSDDIESPTVTVKYRLGKVIANYLSVRVSPNTSATRLDKVYTNDVVKIYNYGSQQKTNNFFSMEPPLIENGQVKVDADGDPVFPQGSGSGGRWLIEYQDLSDGQHYYWDFEDEMEYEETIVVPRNDAGQEIDVGNGSILLRHSDIYALEINSKAEKYPLQLGAERTIEGVLAKNFSIGWDGALYGGSKHPWFIKSDGTASFRWINGQGGTFTNIDLESCNIKEKLTCEGDLYLTAGKHIYFSTNSNSQAFSLYTGTKTVTTGDKTSETVTGLYVTGNLSVESQLAASGILCNGNISMFGHNLSCAGITASNIYAGALLTNEIANSTTDDIGETSNDRVNCTTGINVYGGFGVYPNNSTLGVLTCVPGSGGTVGIHAKTISIASYGTSSTSSIALGNTGDTVTINAGTLKISTNETCYNSTTAVYELVNAATGVVKQFKIRKGLLVAV